MPIYAPQQILRKLKYHQGTQVRNHLKDPKKPCS
jgi:hypothetical protein